MTLFQCILFFAVSWWLVLFVVLPFGVKLADKPGVGHASSAPVNPMLWRKAFITTLITLFITLVAYGVSKANAAAGIYHAGSNDCVAPAALAPDVSINTPAGADLPESAAAANVGVVPTYLDAPASAHTNNKALSDRLGGGVISMGVVTTDTRTGETRINGQPLTATTTKPAHCK